MRTRTGLRSTVLVVGVLLAACNGERVERPGPLKVTSIECEEERATILWRSPQHCGEALRRFLRRNPTLRIASVIPLEYQPVEQELVPTRIEPGTQRLLVVHTEPWASGPWPRAEELDLQATSCPSRYCSRELHKSSLRTVIWVPIESAGSQGTEVLELWRTRAVSK